MDKALFRAYVKELVREQIEESVEKTVRKLLPNILDEAIAEIKGTQRITESNSTKKPQIDRSKLASMMGLERMGDTLSATTNRMIVPENANVDVNNPNVKPAMEAINRDYSQVMKKLGLAK
jgi:hypothetical protein